MKWCWKPFGWKQPCFWSSPLEIIVTYFCTLWDILYSLDVQIIINAHTLQICLFISNCIFSIYFYCIYITTLSLTNFYCLNCSSANHQSKFFASSLLYLAINSILVVILIKIQKQISRTIQNTNFQLNQTFGSWETSIWT